MNIHLPQWMQMDYFTAYNGYNEVNQLLQAGKSMGKMEPSLQAAYEAWMGAPQIGPLHLVLDLPALFIIVLITALVYKGMKESKNASNAMVIVKLVIILLVIAVGIFYVDPGNWSPFAPNGISGILKGVSAVFFAYIGFDAISTTAEECKNPQRDLPRGMMWAIIICTVLYIIIALVLTGMVSYAELNVGDPLAYVFQKLNLKWMSGIIAVSAVVAMASVLLVFQMGQPRIWMSMSRDGLLPKRFSKVHPKYKTPSFATIVVGFVVAIPALFMNLTMVTDLCSIGTLFAFVVVCAGVLVLQNKTDIPRGSFKTPYINGKFVLPAMILTAIILSFSVYQKESIHFLTNERERLPASEVLSNLGEEKILELKTYVASHDQIGLKRAEGDLERYLDQVEEKKLSAAMSDLQVTEKEYFQSGWNLFQHKIPTYLFLVILLVLTYYTITRNLSLIPALGLLSCLYMMSELNLSNWIGFGVWLLVGLLVYFGYSRKNSKLNPVGSV
jgi:amino acid transporter